MPPKNQEKTETQVIAPVVPVVVKLLSHSPKNGKYTVYNPRNFKEVWLVAVENAQFVVGEQELFPEVLSPIFIPDSVPNTLDAVRNYVLP